MRCRVAVLVSGRGSNLQALVDYANLLGDRASYEIAAVLSNKSDAPALELARARGIPASAFAADDAVELQRHLTECGAHLVVLAGYLRKIPAEVVRAYAGKILNVHPALLPAYGGEGMYGARVHQAVIAAGDSESGVTVHLVDDEYDRGPIVAQWRVPVRGGDDAKALAGRVLEAEHILLPRVVDLVAALHDKHFH